MHWRLVDIETRDAFMNMALDEAVSESVSRGDSPATIRFYRWKPNAVSIGYFQSLNREVASDECEKHGIDIVRRRTGGGAVYHDHDTEITYSIIAPEAVFPRDLTASYHEICGYVVNALKDLGFADASFHPINDVLIGPKKVSGNAQTRRGGVLLQHGTILHGVDVKKMFSVLRVGQEKIADKLIKSAEERVTSIRDMNHAITYDEALASLKNAFTTGKSWEHGAWTEGELARARELAKAQYSSSDWNAQR